MTRVVKVLIVLALDQTQFAEAINANVEAITSKSFTMKMVPMKLSPNVCLDSRLNSLWVRIAIAQLLIKDILMNIVLILLHVFHVATKKLALVCDFHLFKFLF